MSAQTEHSISTAVIVGVGLIGGSFAMNLRKHSGVQRLIGIGRSAANLELALERGIIDAYQHEIDENLGGADLFVAAAPLRETASILSSVASVMRSDAIVTDVGSAKREVVAVARASLGEHYGRFVPGHPIAGTEKSGASAAHRSLFQGKLVLLTPEAETDPDALDVMRRLWHDAGARVQTMDVASHDAILARTSHLSHMLAYAIVGSLGSEEDTDRHFDLASGGFYDFTRIASSDPDMWRDICLSNRDSILSAISAFSDQLSAINDSVASGDGEWLRRYFENCRSRRDAAMARRTSSIEPG